MAQRKGGEADSYYNQEPGGQSNGQYAPAPPLQYPPQAVNNGYQGDSNPKYQHPPPNYGQNFQNPGAPPMAAGDGKQTFDQVFKLGTLVGLDAKKKKNLQRRAAFSSYASEIDPTTPVL